MEYYDLGHSIIAFTTDRTVGRDFQKIFGAFERDGVSGSLYILPFDKSTGEGGGRGLYPHQTHTDRVLQIQKDIFYLPEADRKEMLEGVDAVISNVKGVCLGISTADCIPVLVYDEEHHCAAAIHAGWRGTQKRIVEKAVNLMIERYKTNPANCKAVIGPGISMESFEVGDEVYEAFVDADFQMDECVAKRFPCTTIQPNDNGKMQSEKWHLNLKEINNRVLASCGITDVEISPIDTFTDERFFSARREQKGTVKCGRILTGFLLK